MNNRLNGHPFISAYASMEPEEDKLDWTVGELFARLFANARLEKTRAGERFVGLSVPVQQKKLDYLAGFFAEKARKKLPDFHEAYDPRQGPAEFWTAKEVVLSYGQPQDRDSDYRRQSVKRIAKAIFPNAEFSEYPYKHGGENDVALILIVHSLLPQVHAAIYDYISRSWASGDANIGAKLNEALGQPVFDPEMIAGLISQEELLDSDFLGTDTLQSVSEADRLVPFEKRHVVNAISELHRMIHRQKVAVEKPDVAIPGMQASK